jgi:hypothetical protein
MFFFRAVKNFLLIQDSTVWFAVKEEEARRKVQVAESTTQAKEEQKAQRDEMRKELLGEK